MNGTPLRAAEQLRSEVATLVFTPDRLAVVKGGPAARRAYFDRVLGRLSPPRAGLSAEYGAAVAQRNAALRRVSAGFSSADALAPWTERVAELGAALAAARVEAIDRLSPGFAERAEELGLPAGRLAYEGEPLTVAALEARLDRDLERGSTGLGPHLDDVAIASGLTRAARLRLPGRATAGRAVAAPRRGGAAGGERSRPPLVLLDDVLSELDERRRGILAERLRSTGQTFVTATSAASLPIAPDQLIEVSPGAARVA